MSSPNIFVTIFTEQTIAFIFIGYFIYNFISWSAPNFHIVITIVIRGSAPQRLSMASDSPSLSTIFVVIPDTVAIVVGVVEIETG